MVDASWLIAGKEAESEKLKDQSWKFIVDNLLPLL